MDALKTDEKEFEKTLINHIKKKDNPPISFLSFLIYRIK